MGEGLKAEPSVVVSLAALAHAAEGQVRVGQVQDRVVDRHPAGGGQRQEPVDVPRAGFRHRSFG